MNTNPHNTPSAPSSLHPAPCTLHPCSSYVIFEVAGTAYGVCSRNVRHIEMVEHVTPVPDTLPFVDGVVFSRGEVIPALNLRVRFGIEKVPYNLRTRLIVMQFENRTAGFIVDAAREFISISGESLLAPPEEITEMSGIYLKGIARIGERMILILDLEEILKSAEAEVPLPDMDRLLAISNQGPEDPAPAETSDYARME